MFLPFFDSLRAHGVPVSVREYLAFLEGMQAGMVTYDIDGFYYLARTAMVKDERHLDRFDRAFATAFEGLATIDL
ncbi:MAG: VWA domain-containing protein, partial [Pseudomonadota bacterium]